MNRTWMPAIDAHASALTLIENLITHSYRQPAHRRQDLVHQWKADRALLSAAETFTWSPAVIQAVRAASESIPEDARINMWNLPTGAAWWYFEEPIPDSEVKTVTNENAPLRALCFGWVRDPTRASGKVFLVVAWIDDPLRQFRICPSQVWNWEEGETLAEMKARVSKEHDHLYGPGGIYEKASQVGREHFDRAADVLSRFLIAGSVWLEQRVAVTTDGHIERHRRKQLVREMKRSEPRVRIVELRRADHGNQTESVREELDAEGQKVNWSCRWVVDGFFRQQVCGKGRADRRLIYVWPFIKGPADKPLKPKIQKVFRVDR